LQAEGLESLSLDVRDATSIQSAVAEVLAQTGGRLDGLFNNAGYGQPGAVEDVSRAALREQFETNVLGAHELTCQVIPVMRRQGRGRIIFNSSVLGLVAFPYRGRLCRQQVRAGRISRYLAFGVDRDRHSGLPD
jgi:NAD(P)-dependent dehydrogenase (short-subunit alcohol dehydrogenase family)